MDSIAVGRLQIAMNYRVPVEADAFEVVYHDNNIEILVDLKTDTEELEYLCTRVGELNEIRIPLDGDEWCCRAFLQSVTQAEPLEDGRAEYRISLSVHQGHMPTVYQQPVREPEGILLREGEQFVPSQCLEDYTVTVMNGNDLANYSICYDDIVKDAVEPEPQKRICLTEEEADEIGDFIDWSREQRR